VAEPALMIAPHFNIQTRKRSKPVKITSAVPIMRLQSSESKQPNATLHRGL
jgi:hypothetical protein